MKKETISFTSSEFLILNAGVIGSSEVLAERIANTAIKICGASQCHIKCEVYPKNRKMGAEVEVSCGQVDERCGFYKNMGNDIKSEYRELLGSGQRYFSRERLKFYK